MTEIILARHGETEWNLAEIFRGRSDIDLNETGKKQAALLAEYLRDIVIDAIYSSPLKRALRTAEIIADSHEVTPEIAPGLIDFNYGQWQGLSNQQVQTRYTELYNQWMNHPDRVTMPDGESLQDTRKRVISVVGDIIARHKGTVVLVSHRVVNKVLICALLGLDDSHFLNIRQDMCSITTFIYEDGRFILTEHNNTAYLQSLKQPPLGDF